MIEILLSTPFIIKVIVSLFIILIINRLTKNLQLSIAGGIIVLALWSGRSLQDIALISFNRLISPNTLFLIVILFQVIWLSILMSMNKMIEDLVNNVRARVSNRMAMAVLPA